ncbi:MAG: FtsX-like permease family protein [Woeseiaceae bacterium]|nr:FtsX-like permease family protein [Woeseiaceae bacterium]
MRFLAELAWRDLRASGRSLWVFCACLVLGVTLVAGTGGLYRLINAGLLADTRVLLGGDLEVESEEPLPDRALAWMRERGDVSLVTEVDTMLGTTGDEFLRVELQAMDSLYPLYGNLVLGPDLPLAEATASADGRWGAALDAALAERLGLEVGEDIHVGELTMRVRALVLEQPDRALSADWRGAPVLVSDAALAASGLLQAGSVADYDYRVRTALPAEEWQQAFHAAFPDEAWEVRTFEDRSRRIAERLDQLASGLLIIGFSTLFIGGLGVFNSIQAYLQGKLKTMATLRALGLRNRRLAAVYLLQVAILSGGASVVGAAIGTALALAGAGIIAAEVPLATNLASLVAPALVAAGFGLVTAYAFALPAIGRALAVEPASLFRGGFGRAARPPAGWWLAALACAALIVSLVLLALPDTAFGGGFLLTVGLLLLLLDLVVRGIRRAARRLDDHPWLERRFALRLAVANLHRPGTPLRAALLSLGSALTLLVACTLVVAALLRTINNTIPAESPALVLYDIADRQLADVVAAIEASPGPARVETTPLVRSRIVAINGRALDELPHLDSEQRRDASQDDYDLSYSAGNIDDVSLAAGDWWHEDSVDSPRLALEDYEAGQLDLAVGDVITFGIAGDTLEATVDAIFSQKGIQTRFWFEGIVSDGALEGLVSRHVGAAYMDDAAALAAQRRVGAIAPNVITVRTAALLASARDILGKAAAGLAVVAGVSLLASLLVLISVMAAGRTRQVYDATVLHSLGTRMAVIRRSLHLEYLLLALVTSAFAVLLGSAVALPLLNLRLRLPSDDLLWLGAVTALAVSGLSLWLGARYLLRRLRLRPAVLLRGAN